MIELIENYEKVNENNIVRWENRLEPHPILTCVICGDNTREGVSKKGHRFICFKCSKNKFELMSEVVNFLLTS